MWNKHNSYIKFFPPAIMTPELVLMYVTVYPTRFSSERKTCIIKIHVHDAYPHWHAGKCTVCWLLPRSVGWMVSDNGKSWNLNNYGTYNTVTEKSWQPKS